MNNGGEGSAAADVAQRSDDPVSVVVDVEHRTLLLKNTGNKQEVRV